MKFGTNEIQKTYGEEIEQKTVKAQKKFEERQTERLID